MKKFSPKLIDWRIEDNAEIDPKPVPTVVEIRDTRIDIKFLNDRSIWIEQEDGVVKVRCYAPHDDEPLSIALTGQGLTILQN